MQWWCSATNAEWNWNWQAYPGIWLAVLLIGGLYWRRLRLTGAGRPVSTLWFVLGLLTLWLSLDWPAGALGTGYLLSVHTAQYVVLTLVAVPLLLVGTPPGILPRVDSRAGRRLRRITHPGLGLFLYVVALGVTHVPAVTDSLMPTQVGSFLIDLVWVVGALALWWPVLAPPAYVRMSPPLRIGYLFAATIPPIVPAAFLVFADYPLYGLYELAPRVAGITASADQQAAGLLMKAVGDPLLWTAMAIVFFRWQRDEERTEKQPTGS